ncbi:MAG: hypothetical protein NT067_02900 [Candidatus Diapherotrites archaeon]|nr:hypothetical protein [Candidatus Diapherotrites archaeon]
MPTGMVLVLIVECLGILGLLESFRGPMQFGPLFLTGWAAIFLVLVHMAANGLVVFGIIKRLKWAWKFILALYVLAIVLGIANSLFFAFDGTVQENYVRYVLTPELEGSNLSISAGELFSLVLPITLFVVAITIAVNIAIAVYLFKKKDFFTN